MEVSILGCGAALPAGGRHCSGQVVTVDGRRFLVDCGEGTQTQLRIAHQKLQAMDTILLSHLHGDHWFGLPGLLSSMHLCGRKDPVDVYAPKGLQPLLDNLFEMSSSHIDYELRVHEIAPGILLETPKVRITAFPLRHTVETYGFRFQELSPRHPASYAYCSDTGYYEALAEEVAGVDLLCAESTFGHSYASLAEERGHLTALQAAIVAQKAGAGRLMLTHFSARYKEVDVLLEEAQQVFANTIAATEGETLRIVAKGTL